MKSQSIKKQSATIQIKSQNIECKKWLSTTAMKAAMLNH